MMRVGGQSGTAMRRTMSSATAGGGPDPSVASPMTAPARNPQVVRLFRPIPLLPCLCGSVDSLNPMKPCPALLADGNTGLPKKQMRVGRRQIELDLAADVVGQGAVLGHDELEHGVARPDVDDRDVAERLGQADAAAERRSPGRLARRRQVVRPDADKKLGADGAV